MTVKYLLTANEHKKTSRVTLTPEDEDEESKGEGANCGDGEIIFVGGGVKAKLGDFSCQG